MKVLVLSIAMIAGMLAGAMALAEDSRSAAVVCSKARAWESGGAICSSFPLRGAWLTDIC